MDIIALYEEYHLPYDTSGKNVSPGWVQVQCPFCDDHSNHLGYNVHRNYFKCWRCGVHKKVETLQKLLSMTEQEVRRVIGRFSKGQQNSYIPTPTVIPRTKAFKFPAGTAELGVPHTKYLAKRGFDPGEIQAVWGVKGTGPMAELDGVDYRMRILAPIHWDGKIVSFQGRDITDKNPPKYLACTKERERVHHKDILYGHPKTTHQESDRLVVVEGITDVWKLGVGAVATFGIQFKPSQVQHLCDLARELVILFDTQGVGAEEKQARRQAVLLMTQLI